MQWFEAWLDAHPDARYTDPVLAYWRAFKGEKEVSWQVPGVTMKIGDRVRRTPQWERLLWEIASYYQLAIRSGLWKQVFRGIYQNGAGEWTFKPCTARMLSHLTSRRPMRIMVTPGTRRTEWCSPDGPVGSTTFRAARGRKNAAGICEQLSLPLEF